jgi:hypothetical protein
VNTVVVKQGRDRKLYPAEPLTRAELNRRRWLAHRLHCEGGLSIRAVQATMLESYGVRRSVGAIYRDLARFECPRCAGQPDPAPVAAEQPQARVHQAPGGLTGMIERDG